MKETKEKNILIIESDEEAKLFKSIATGRKFFKRGERVIDICEQEIIRYRYENSGIIHRLLIKIKNKREKYMIENRNSSIIRAIAAYCIREKEEELNSIEITNEVRKYILDIVEEYYKKDTSKNKIIDIKTKEKKEVS